MDELKLEVLDAIQEYNQDGLICTDTLLGNRFISNAGKVATILGELATDGFISREDDRNSITTAGREFLNAAHRENLVQDMSSKAYTVSVSTLNVLKITCVCTAISALATLLTFITTVISR